jgi:TIR domain
VLKSGQARGGGIGLVKATKNSARKGLTLFISYCHTDEGLMKQLHKHLEPLREMGLVHDWHDGDISAGKDWEQEILTKLRTADIVLLLISIDFINSPFCREVELKEALKRHQRGKTIIIPIILRSCMWKNIIGELQALPTGAQAVTTWDDKDAAFTNIAEGIEKSARERLGVASADGKK